MHLEKPKRQEHGTEGGKQYGCQMCLNTLACNNMDRKNIISTIEVLYSTFLTTLKIMASL
jgi:transposase-like protein